MEAADATEATLGGVTYSASEGVAAETAAPMCEIGGDPTWHADFTWWTDGIAMLMVGSFGFLANSVVIPVLFTKKMNNTFSRFLVCLAIFDNVYVTCSILECVRKYFWGTELHKIIFVHFLFPVQNIALLCSIYTTVVLAVQRYLAISKPLEYYIDGATSAAAGGRQWWHVCSYTLPITFFSTLFNLPKFFEFTTVRVPHPELNDTYIEFRATPMRVDENYSFYYVNLTRLIVTGIIPFGALAVLNLSIYRFLRRRHPLQSNQHLQQLHSHHQGSNEEVVLFAVVFVFLVSSVPRLVLNLYEVFVISMIQNSCFRLPSWVLVMTSVSALLITLNSSLNFIIYCAMCRNFRRSLAECWAQVRRKVARGATEWRDATQHATRRATQLSVSCVTAVTEATAAVRAAEEAEAISITGVETSAVAAQEEEDQSAVLDEDGGQGTTRPVQIRQSLRMDAVPVSPDAERRPSPTFIRRGSLAGKSALSALAKTAAARAANGAQPPKSRSTDV